MNIPALFDEEVRDATLAEVTRQRNALASQVANLSAIVRSIPSVIASARLDAKEGKQTKYDYRKAARALAIRV